MIIGITGTLGAGKGAVVDYLVSKKGFRHVSARSIWTKELKARNLPVDRDHMTVLANELRAENGAAYFMELALASVENAEENVVIESVRTVGEVDLLKEKGGYLLAVDAEKEERYSRITGRNSALDGVSYEDFVRQEETEMQNDDPAKQNIARVIEVSDYKIENNGTMEELRERTEDFLEKFEN